jgi:hypothetical protein
VTSTPAAIPGRFASLLPAQIAQQFDPRRDPETRLAHESDSEPPELDKK